MDSFNPENFNATSAKNNVKSSTKTNKDSINYILELINRKSKNGETSLFINSLEKVGRIWLKSCDFCGAKEDFIMWKEKLEKRGFEVLITTYMEYFNTESYYPHFLMKVSW